MSRTVLTVHFLVYIGIGSQHSAFHTEEHPKKLQKNAFRSERGCVQSVPLLASEGIQDNTTFSSLHTHDTKHETKLIVSRTNKSLVSFANIVTNTLRNERF